MLTVAVIGSSSGHLVSMSTTTANPKYEGRRRGVGSRREAHGGRLMKKLATGLFVTATLVSLAACNKTENTNTAVADNASTASEAMDANAVSNAVMAENATLADSGTMAMGNNTTTSNGTDPMGTSGGH